MKHSRQLLMVLFSVIVLDLIGFAILLPILPFYAESFGVDPNSRGLTWGLLLTCYAAMQFLSAPLWGRLSDKIGRKKVLLLTITGSIGGLIILALAQNLAWLFAGRMLAGLFAGNLSVATAYITDVTTEENRTKSMALIGVAFGIGFILGPLLGGVLSGHGNFTRPIWVAAGLSVLNVIYAAFVLEESHHHQKKQTATLKQAFQYPLVRRLCLLNFLFTLAICQLEVSFAYFMKDRFHYSARQVGYLMGFTALIMVAVQGGGIRKLAARFGERQLILVGALCLSGSFLALPWPASLGFLLIPLVFSSIGRGISQPSLLSTVSKQPNPKLRGVIMGSFHSSASLARVLGYFISGLLYDLGQSTPFYAASILMFIMFGLSWIFIPQTFHPTTTLNPSAAMACSE